MLNKNIEKIEKNEHFSYVFEQVLIPVYYYCKLKNISYGPHI